MKQKMLSRIVMLFMLLASAVMVLLFVCIMVALVPIGAWLAVMNVMVSEISVGIMVSAVIAVVLSLKLKSFSVFFRIIAMFLFVVGAVEKALVYNARRAAIPLDIVSSNEITVHDSVLLFAARPNTIDTVKAFYRGFKIYDAIVTTDSSGHRISCERSVKKKATTEFVFLGGEKAFGQGLSDHETIPYLVHRRDTAAMVTNLALPGYGIQQFQTLIARQRPKEDSTRIRFIYLSDLGQVNIKFTNEFMTAVGIASKKNGIPIPTSLSSKIKGSYVFRLINDTDKILLYGAELKKLDRQIKKIYPNSTFEIIFWDGPDNESKDVGKYLKTVFPRVGLVSEIIPGYYDNLAKYTVGYPYSRYPNRLVANRISKYIVAN